MNMLWLTTRRWPAALALAALALAGCPDKPAPRKSELVVQMETEPSHLVSMLKPDFWARHIASDNIFEPLVRMNPRTYKYEPALASTWQVSDDGLSYTFYLRQGVRWHDGQPFSGADVKLTLDRVMDPKVKAGALRSALAATMERYELVKPDQLLIVCKQKSPFFLDSIIELDILPAHLLRKGDLNTHPFLRKPVGTGPYRFGTWSAGQRITLERNDKYWGRKARIKRLVYRKVGNSELALRLARKGELHLVPRIRPAQWVGRVRKDVVLRHEFIKTKAFPPGIMYVMFNHQRPLFADQRVRRALAMLWDLDTIGEKIMHGLMQRVGALYWYKDPDYNHQIKPLKFDPAAARKLLIEAGFGDSDKNGVLDRGGKPLRFTFLVPTASKSLSRWLTIYQQHLRKAGVVLEISPMEWGPYMDRLRKHDFDAAATGMRLTTPHTDLFSQVHTSQIAAGQNYSGYSNPKVDRLLDGIRIEMDPAKRRIMSLRLQQLLADDVALVPLFAEMAPGLVSRKVHGVYTSALWYQPRDWWID